MFLFYAAQVLLMCVWNCCALCRTSWKTSWLRKIMKGSVSLASLFTV